MQPAQTPLPTPPRPVEEICRYVFAFAAVTAAVCGLGVFAAASAGRDNVGRVLLHLSLSTLALAVGALIVGACVRRRPAAPLVPAGVQVSPERAEFERALALDRPASPALVVRRRPHPRPERTR